MDRLFRWRRIVIATLVLFLAAPLGVRAQGNPEPTGFKFNNGQGVQPIFEGWSKNADGTFEMWYGYYNRNYQETLVVPTGNDNRVTVAAVGQADRGQPTVFLPRIHRKQFSVTVPADFAKKELIWSLTVRGVTEKAIGWLQREWEIDPIYAGKARSPESLKNTKPALTVEVPATLAMPATLQLSATVVDDGLPKPRPPQTGPGANDPPTLKPLPDQPEIPTNVPGVGGRQQGGGGGNQGQRGATVNWVVWRGPAAVVIAPATTPVKEQKAAATATFTKPGTYILRATANDGELTVQKDVTVTVTGTPQ